MLFMAFGTQDPEQREGAVAAQWSTDRGCAQPQAPAGETTRFKATCFSLKDKEVATEESQLFN
jgi:hypothetical protein